MSAGVPALLDVVGKRRRALGVALDAPPLDSPLEGTGYCLGRLFDGDGAGLGGGFVYHHRYRVLPGPTRQFHAAVLHDDLLALGERNRFIERERDRVPVVAHRRVGHRGGLCRPELLTDVDGCFLALDAGEVEPLVVVDCQRLERLAAHARLHRRRERVGAVATRNETTCSDRRVALWL